MNSRTSIIILAIITLGGCNTNPGGLSDAEFNSLSPDRKAELRMEQETLNEERMMHSEQQMDRYQRNKGQHNWQHEAERDAAEAMQGKDLSGLK